MSSRASIYGKDFSTGVWKMKQPTPDVFCILRANDSARGKTGMFLSNLNFSYFILPPEVIFPQAEIAAARENLLFLQYVLLQEPG